eukprot:TCONS_00012610-protein
MFSHLVLFSSIFLLIDGYKLPYQIPGPRSLDDKIAIVGAGPAGIHMALLLKEKGFANIEILEKSDRIGGKSNSIQDRGTVHELGTVYLSKDYQMIKDLSEKYVPGDTSPFPPASVWLDNMTAPIPFTTYAGGFVAKTLGITDQQAIMMEILRALTRYQELHREIFGEYTGELMPQPSKENMEKIRGTFLEFIIRNGLQALVPLFQASTTFQGYGHIDEVAALYGLMWNTPNFINGFKERLAGKGFGDMNILKSGFQNLWETIVNKENLRVTFNVDILKIYRPITSVYKTNQPLKESKCRQVWIAKRTGNEALPTWEKYNFLIWSPEMKDSLHLWKETVDKEIDLFSKTMESYFTASVVDTRNMVRGQTPIDYWVDNVVKKRDHSVWAQRDSYGVINRHMGPGYQSGSLPTGDDGDEKRTTVVYQMSRNIPSESYLKKKLRKHFDTLNAQDLNIKQFKTWRYFPHYQPKDIEDGILWKILEIQGRFNMWYIGSSVSFESVKSVVEYNSLIVENMEPVAR